MQGPFLRKYGVEATINFVLHETDGASFKSDASHASGDSVIMKDEGAEGNTTNGFVDEGTGYSITLTATEMEAARIVVYVVDQTSPAGWLDEALVIETYGNASAQHAFDLNTATQDVNVSEISGDGDAADNLELVWKNLKTASVDDASAGAGNFDTTLTPDTAGAFRGAIILFTSGSLAGIMRYVISSVSGSGSGATLYVQPDLPSAPGDGDNFIVFANSIEHSIVADAVLDEAVADHDTFGTELGWFINEIKDIIDTNGVVLADDAITAAKIASNAITSAKIAAGAITSTGLATSAVEEIADQVWDEALSGHTDGGSAGEAAGRLDDIQTDTEDLQTQIGTAGDGLTGVPWNAAWDAEVQSEVQDAVEANHLDHLLAADYDPASKPGVATALLNELVENDGGVSRFTENALEQGPGGATAADIADQVWDEATAGHSGAGSAGKALTDALADTNELQGDLTDGGRLDLILDAILADTGTDGVVLADGAITAAKVAADAITAAKIAADAIGASEIADGAIDAGAIASDAITAAKLAADAITAAKIADDAIDAGAIAEAAGNKIADHIIRRSFENACDSSDGDTKTFRSLLGAIAKLVNKVTVIGGTLTVYEDDDVTSLGTQTVSTDSGADPITSMDTD